MKFPPDWEILPLDNCVSAIIDYRGKTPTKTSVGIPLITAKIVKNGRIEEPNEFISEESYNSWMTRGYPQSGDVVITTEAPLGEVAQLGHGRVALAQRIILLRGDQRQLDNSYLKYFLSSDYGQSQLRSRSSGTTVTGIKQSELRKINVVLPPLEEQKGIADTLRALDDKIELNSKINATLEQMAQALFKSWFVDFDPVKANAAGDTLDGLDRETAALFPNEFEENKLGELIPKGWITSTIGEEVEVLGGSTPSTKEPLFWEGGVHHWVTPRDLAQLSDKVLLDTDRKITNAGLQQISSGQLPVGTVLLSSRAPIGYLALSQIPVSINQGFIAMVCNKRLSQNYVLHWAEHSMSKIEERASGTTFAEISKSNFRPISVIVPSREVIRRFDDLVTPIYQQITEKVKENTTLSQLRDELLPQLISGKLRFADLDI